VGCADQHFANRSKSAEPVRHPWPSGKGGQVKSLPERADIAAVTACEFPCDSEPVCQVHGAQDKSTIHVEALAAAWRRVSPGYCCIQPRGRSAWHPLIETAACFAQKQQKLQERRNPKPGLINAFPRIIVTPFRPPVFAGLKTQYNNEMLG